MFKHLLFNHLANSFWVFIYISSSILILSGAWWLFLPMLIGVYFLSYLFRENIEEKLLENVETKLSISTPAIGEVVSILKFNSMQSIDISIPAWGPYGIHAPSKAELQYVGHVVNFAKPSSIENKDWESLNLKDFDYILTFKTFSGSEYWLILKKFILSPNISLRTGDRCTKGACLGLLPLGGKIILLIPNSMGTLVDMKQFLNSINTPISVAIGD
jgi:hypothetical protein